jgi:hypothetical protein
MSDRSVADVDAAIGYRPVDSEHLTETGRGNQLPPTNLDGWNVAGARRIVGSATRDAEKLTCVLDTHGGLDCRVGDRRSRLEVLSTWH